MPNKVSIVPPLLEGAALGLRAGGRHAEERELSLLRRIAGRDREAFKELYLIYHRRLLRFISRLTQQHDRAEEILNDTMWTVWTKAAEFRGASRLSTWVFGIAYRQALAHSRRNRSRHKDQKPLEEEAVTDDSSGLTERREWLDRGLSQLPMEQRTVIELTYYLGLSCEEIAQVMDCPINTVKTRMFYARKKLRQDLSRLAQPHRELGQEESDHGQ